MNESYESEKMLILHEKYNSIILILLVVTAITMNGYIFSFLKGDVGTVLVSSLGARTVPVDTGMLTSIEDKVKTTKFE